MLTFAAYAEDASDLRSPLSAPGAPRLTSIRDVRNRKRAPYPRRGPFFGRAGRQVQTASADAGFRGDGARPDILCARHILHVA
jgi:hypothetical protein